MFQAHFLHTNMATKISQRLTAEFCSFPKDNISALIRKIEYQSIIKFLGRLFLKMFIKVSLLDDYKLQLQAKHIFFAFEISVDVGQKF